MHSTTDRAKTQFEAKVGPFQRVEPVSSDKSRLIQATDVITGAIAYEKNRAPSMPKAALHKKALWEHVKLSTRLDTLAKPNFGFLSQRFTILDFDFTKSKPPKKQASPPTASVR